MTKEEILSALSLLPLSKLEQLYKYSTYNVIPDEDLLVNVTMTQMMDKANQLRATYFPEWTDWSSADAGKFLIELFALFSEKDFLYVNSGNNETILSKMRIYSDAFIRAVELGHEPILVSASSSSFDVSFALGNNFDYPEGGLVIELADSKLRFTNIAPFNVPTTLGVTQIPLTLYEGKWVSDSTTFNGKSIPIRKKDVAIDSIKLTGPDSTSWTRVKNFGQSTSGDRHYMVLPEIDGSASIWFGEDGYGSTPDIGSSFTFGYLQCSGSLGTPTVLESATIQKYTTRIATNATHTAISTKGTDQESLASLKNTTLNYFSGKKHAYNKASVESFLNSQDEIHNSKATIMGANVYFRVIPKDGTIAAAPLLTDLEGRLNKVISGGYTASGFVTTYISTTPVVGTAYLYSGTNIERATALIKQLIQDYTNPLVLAKYGVSFTPSDVVVLLLKHVPGLQNFTFTTPGAPISVLPDYIMEKVELADISITPVTVY